MNTTHNTARRKRPWLAFASVLLALTSFVSAQSNSDLSDLVPSAGTLIPVFDSATIDYTATVPFATTSMTVTPTVVEAGATVTVNATPVTSGDASDPISLSVGANVITTVVTSQDTTTTKTYTLTVTREAASTNADLSGLVPSVGTLDPVFDSGTIAYTAAAQFSSSSMTVTPTAAGIGATITVNGNPVASGSPSDAIALSVGANVISTEVTAEDGTTTKTYTLTVTRVAVADLVTDFQATISSEQHPIGQPAGGEARYYNVSVNAANPGTGAYRATIPGTNDPAPPFVRNFDGPVLAYKFSGGSNDNINGVDAVGGDSGKIVFTTTDTTFDRFGQQQGRLWTGNDPGHDLQVSISDPVNGTTGSTGGKGGWRSLNDATGTIDVTGLAAGSVHIYYGDFGAKPTLSVVMRDTAAVDPAPDITIANAHLNDDTANRTEYYLAEIDFVTDGVYDVVEFVWTSGGGNGRGLAVVLTEAVADAVAPTLAPADIVDNRGGGPIDTDGNPVIYTVTYSEFMDPATIGADDFEVIATGTAGGTIESVVHYGKVTTVNFLPTEGTDGTIQLQVKAGAVLADLAGNELDTTTAIADDTVITVNPDTTPPTVASFDSPTPSGTIYGTPTITYTVTFSEPISTALDATNFTNGGTAAATIGTVTDISPGGLEPSVYTVELIPSGTGTLQLEVQGTVEDGSGNALVVPVTDAKVFTIDTGAEPARETVTLDGFATSNSSTNPHNLVFDASASDKLVVIVTGENGNPGSLAGNVISVTYDGVALTQAVDRAPIGSAPSAAFDQTYNDIWYLDNPAAATASASVDDPDLGTTGNIRASVDSRGVITAIRLSGTAPGFGATAISAQEVKTVDVLAATSGGMVIASHGMGGNGNSANTQSVNTVPAEAELSAVKSQSDWNGHVTSRTSVTSPSVVTSTFTGGNTVGSHTIAAEFLGALVSGGSPYDTWAAINAPTGNPNDDFDGDGVDNAVEFVLGGDKDTNDLDKLPSAATSGGNMTFTFVRDQDSVDAGVSVVIEVGTNLSTWPDVYTVGADTAGSTAGVTVTDNLDGTDTITLTVTQAPDAKKFARLKVLITP